MWTNTQTHLDKYTKTVGQIHKTIWTNTQTHLDKYTHTLHYIQYIQEPCGQPRHRAQNHRIIDSLTHWFIDSLIHWFMDSLIHWFIDSLIHRIMGSSIHWFIDSSIHVLMVSSIHRFIDSLIRWFIDALVHWFVGWYRSLRWPENLHFGVPGGWFRWPWSPFWWPGVARGASWGPEAKITPIHRNDWYPEGPIWGHVGVMLVTFSDFVVLKWEVRLWTSFASFLMQFGWKKTWRRLMFS